METWHTSNQLTGVQIRVITVLKKKHLSKNNYFRWVLSKQMIYNYSSIFLLIKFKNIYIFGKCFVYMLAAQFFFFFNEGYQNRALSFLNFRVYNFFLLPIKILEKIAFEINVFSTKLQLDGRAVVVTSFVTFQFNFNAIDKAITIFFYLTGWECQWQPSLTIIETWNL